MARAQYLTSPAVLPKTDPVAHFGYFRKQPDSIDEQLLKPTQAPEHYDQPNTG